MILHFTFIYRLVLRHSFSNFQASLFLEVSGWLPLPTSLLYRFLHTFSIADVTPLGQAAFLAFMRFSASVTAYTDTLSQGPSIFLTFNSPLHSFSSFISFSLNSFHTSYPPDSPFYFHRYHEFMAFQQYLCFFVFFFLCFVLPFQTKISKLPLCSKSVT